MLRLHLRQLVVLSVLPQLRAYHHTCHGGCGSNHTPRPHELCSSRVSSGVETLLDAFPQSSGNLHFVVLHLLAEMVCPIAAHKGELWLVLY